MPCPRVCGDVLPERRVEDEGVLQHYPHLGTQRVLGRLADVLACPVEELLSAAKKMPADLNDSVGQPAALRFLQEASRLRLSKEEWEQLLGKLHGLRSDQGEEDRK